MHKSVLKAILKVKKQESAPDQAELESLKKPYVSEAQRRWAHTPAGMKALGGKKAVEHWDKESKGKKLPERVSKSDKLKGGLADNKTNEDFPKDQLEIGKEVEMEHTNDPEIAEEIARDHLVEDKRYYTKLLRYLEPHHCKRCHEGKNAVEISISDDEAIENATQK